MDAEQLRMALAGRSIAGLRYFDSLGSTNDEALAWAESGAPDTALVVADTQTRGKGRMGRQWITNPGAALAFSLIVRPTPAEREHLALFSPLAGLGVAVALEAFGLTPQVKWPNDVLLANKKVCGILAEAAWSGDQLRGVVIGVGVNVAPSSVPPMELLLYPATCVETQVGSPVDRLKLLDAILQAIFHWRGRLGSDAFMATWQERLAFLGQQVAVIPPSQQAVQGRLAGVDSQGSLRLVTDDGREVILAAGDVHLRPAK